MIYKIDIENNDNVELFIENSICTVRFRNHILFNDSSLECIKILKRMLEKALNNELEISSEFDDVSIGKWWNDYTDSYVDDEIETEDLAQRFWLWSTRYVQTWLFNRNSKIYLEISLSYPWHFVEPRENEDFISYHEFIRSFQPIIIFEILSEQAIIIIDKCSRILDNIEK